MTEALFEKLAAFQAFLLSPAFMFSPIYVPSTVLLAFLVWRRSRRDESFLGFLAPRALYRHPSTWVDIKVTIFNMLALGTSALSLSFLAPMVTYGLLTLLAGGSATEATETTWQAGLFAAAILFVSEDFVRYLNHALHHRSPVLWPFHAVHHSAEVLTPLTFLRGHPVYYLIQRVILALVEGSLQAFLLYGLVGKIDFWMIYASTLAFQFYVFLGAHLRHSHIRLSYGRVLEHILISPAQHQIHHSVDPRHYNKNLGEIFALWDWMFGTLYIPTGKEDLRFGLGDNQGNPVPQPYSTLTTAMVRPFGESLAALRRPRASLEKPGIGLAAVPDEQ